MAMSKEPVQYILGDRLSVPQSRIHRQFVENLLENDTSNNTAVFDHSGNKMTYESLNTRANRMARKLAACYPVSTKGPHVSVIGILMSPSVDCVLAILAVIKTGAAYLPMDPNLPPSRIQYMTDVTTTGIVISDTRMDFKLNAQVITLDYLKTECESSSLETSNLNVEEELGGSKTNSSPLALFFTSGTTGKPKPVVITHQNVTNATRWFER